MPLIMYEFQSHELISGTSPATEGRLLSIDRTKCSVITVLLTGQNTLRRHPYVMGLCKNRTCRKSGTEEETSAHILYECETVYWSYQEAWFLA